MLPEKRAAHEEPEDEEDEDEIDTIEDDDKIFPLPEAKVVNERIGELFDRVKKGRINLNPPYQRDVVWNARVQERLIESIFANLWVPLPVLNRRSQSKALDVWNCIDGKQRLTSIKMFMEGLIPYRDPVTRKPLYFKKAETQTKNGGLLDEKHREIFREKTLYISVYQDLTDAQERAVFTRIQEGMTLEIGEKLRARQGPWADYVDELTHRYMHGADATGRLYHDGWHDRIIKTTRGSDFKVMLMMVRLIRELYQESEPTLATSMQLQNDVEPLGLKEPPEEEFKAFAHQFLDKIMELSRIPSASEESSRSPRRGKVVRRDPHQAFLLPKTGNRPTMLSPVELVLLPYLLYYHMERCDNGYLLELIQSLKQFIRTKYPGNVKTNTKVFNALVFWIKTFKVSNLSGEYLADAAAAPVGNALLNGAPSQTLHAAPEPFPNLDNNMQPKDGAGSRPKKRPRVLGRSGEVDGVFSVTDSQRGDPKPIPSQRISHSQVSTSARPGAMASAGSGLPVARLLIEANSAESERLSQEPPTPRTSSFQHLSGRPPLSVPDPSHRPQTHSDSTPQHRNGQPSASRDPPTSAPSSYGSTALNGSIKGSVPIGYSLPRFSRKPPADQELVSSDAKKVKQEEPSISGFGGNGTMQGSNLQFGLGNVFFGNAGYSAFGGQARD